MPVLNDGGHGRTVPSLFSQLKLVQEPLSVRSLCAESPGRLARSYQGDTVFSRGSTNTEPGANMDSTENSERCKKCRVFDPVATAPGSVFVDSLEDAYRFRL